jgi:hypothetical protein
MGKGLLEAFSDGVIAIIITVMVLELKLPHGAGLTCCCRCCPSRLLRPQFHLRWHLLEQAPECELPHPDKRVAFATNLFDYEVLPMHADDNMPMIPGPFAAITYAGIKIIGYAGFAYGLNCVLSRKINVWKFGAAKTAIGLVGGLGYVFAVFSLIGAEKPSDFSLFAGALPIRLAAWTVALALFYGFRERPKILIAAVVVGTIWSYILDGVMAVLYHLPGMQMPFC